MSIVDPATGQAVPLITTPGVNPVLANNPQIYYGKLTGLYICPGAEEFKDCIYRKIKRDPDVADANRDWTCPAGNFCQAQGLAVKCKPGFFCPPDAVEPLLCPSRYFCDRNATTITRCEKNTYCLSGSVGKGYNCFGASCPAGSSSANKFGLLIFFMIFAIIVWFLFKWQNKRLQLRFLKHSKQVKEAKVLSSQKDAPLQRLSKTFDLEFTDLGLVLGNGIEIMSGVTGALKSGRTCAIMGPSGAGKTTFVTLLTGKTKRTSGVVKVNGVVEELSKYKKLIGYVPQEDVMLRELTVRDILMHSARMRLPADWTFKQIREKVDNIVNILGIDHIYDKVIGDAENRGISGGQRKRVNIGMELVAEPSVLFLDEPTSGLDSSTSFEVCAMLRNVARGQGLNIAAVIHSPSPATFKQFDDLLLLGKGGRIIYFGPVVEASSYFDSIGFTCPPDESPSDFFMDVASGKVESHRDNAFKPADLFKYWVNHKEGKGGIGAAGASLTSIDYDPTPSYSGGHENTGLVGGEKIEKINTWTDGVAKALGDILRDLWFWISDIAIEIYHNIIGIYYLISCTKDPVRQTCGFPWQFWLLTRRAFTQVFRSAKSFLLDQFMHFGVGVFISVAIQNFQYLGPLPDEICNTVPLNLRGICARASDQLKETGMFICLGVLFAGISVGSQTFGREKIVYWRDTSAGMSTIPYYLGKYIIDLFRILLAGIMFSIALIIFWPYRQSWFTVLIVVEMLYLSAFPMGYFISYAFNQNSVALVGTGFSLLWALVLSGVIPTLTDVYGKNNINDVAKDTAFTEISWLWNISAPRHAIEAFYVKEVVARDFEVPANLPNLYQLDNFGGAIYAMFIIQIGWNVLAWLTIKVTNRRKQK
ncbi:hypothetical protein HK099_006078 [Clydaea vesicula]|uniref:ABC transporter domain-containing protein n=1 Tax=Clydaea vesicula TaxID=447962 RepID=A0AAD5XUJ9_9FUNG|nr:hypothetical protein HK099_006078 [Clydaea vesicula]KAJ3391894.1 hypothetical protein HDU92_008740 [Lobulomyces angularis]